MSMFRSSLTSSPFNFKIEGCIYSFGLVSTLAKNSRGEVRDIRVTASSEALCTFSMDLHEAFFIHISVNCIDLPEGEAQRNLRCRSVYVTGSHVILDS